jgi:hypothetical protein
MKIEKRDTTKPGLVQITTMDERWYYNEKLGIYRPSSSWISSYYPKGIAFYKWLGEKGWNEAEAIKHEAGNRGTRVHMAVEALTKGATIAMTDMAPNQNTGFMEEFSVEEWEAIMSFVDWYKEVKPEIISLEQTVENSETNYAGTLDLKCRINGQIWIIDYKTSQYIWPSHEIQLSSYKHCDGHEDVQKIGILQLGYKLNKKRFKFTEIEDQYIYFLATRQLWYRENKDVAPKQKDYPLSLTLVDEVQMIQTLIDEAPKQELVKKENSNA